jgi:hypothetical protein
MTISLLVFSKMELQKISNGKTNPEVYLGLQKRKH